MYVCMYVYKLAPHKIFGKICIFEHFSNKKCDRYMYVCMYTSWHHINFLVWLKYAYLSTVKKCEFGGVDEFGQV